MSRRCVHKFDIKRIVSTCLQDKWPCNTVYMCVYVHICNLSMLRPLLFDSHTTGTPLHPQSQQRGAAGHLTSYLNNMIKDARVEPLWCVFGCTTCVFVFIYSHLPYAAVHTLRVYVYMYFVYDDLCVFVHISRVKAMKVNTRPSRDSRSHHLTHH